MKKQKLPYLVLTTFLAGILISSSGESPAQCSPGEMTAVFILEGILPGEEISIEKLHVYEVGEATYPSEQEMIDSIPQYSGYGYYFHSSFGAFHLFSRSPMDSGGAAIIDSRSGEIAFAGTIGWWGGGSIVIPVTSTHPWALSPIIAESPSEFGMLPNPNCYFFSEEELTEISNRILEYLLGVDLVVNFGECGAYGLVVFLHAPNAQWIDGEERGVAVVYGNVWSDEPVATESESFGGLKALFR